MGRREGNAGTRSVVGRSSPSEIADARWQDAMARPRSQGEPPYRRLLRETLFGPESTRLSVLSRLQRLSWREADSLGRRFAGANCGQVAHP